MKSILTKKSFHVQLYYTIYISQNTVIQITDNKTNTYGMK